MDTIDVIIKDHERGLLYRDGRLIEWLEPGRHRRWAWRAEWRVERLDLDLGYVAATPELRQVVPDGVGYEVVIEAEHLGVVTVDGEPLGALTPGRYILWQVRADVRATVYDTSEIQADISQAHAGVIPANYLTSYVIPEDQRGVLTVDGRARAWLDVGRHHIWTRDRLASVQYLHIDQGYLHADNQPEIARVMPRGAAEPLEVAVGEVALLYREGRSFACLGPGSYLIWQLRRQINARVYSTRPLMTEIPEEDWKWVSSQHLVTRLIHPYERGLLWVDGSFEGVLEAGRYGLHCDGREVECQVVELRERELQIQGQEVMTADKVTLRLNLIVKFSVTDPRATVERQTDLNTAMYSEAQLVARSYVAGVKLDELLEARNAASEAMNEDLRPRAESWGVRVERVDVKDVILPGEMKTLLNQVIEAEKQAAAHVIARREETSATRAQANTAKMMENNPMLKRLKEMDAVREIAQSVGHITIVAGSDELVRMVRRQGD